jgi:hypothetical protein
MDWCDDMPTRPAKPTGTARAKATNPGRPAAIARQPAPAKPASTKPASTKPSPSKPASSKPAPTKPASSKPASSKPSPGEAVAVPRERPRALRVAAALVAVEAAGMCVAAGFSAVSTANGQSYQAASGVALTLIAVGVAVVFALFAAGLARARPWTRTPVVMTQLAIGAWGIYLLRDHRLDWGVPMLLVAAGCLTALFTPASLRALNRPPMRP